MSAPRMLPGQTPYTEAELAKLHKLVGEAADGDPGERDEQWYTLCARCGHTLLQHMPPLPLCKKYGCRCERFVDKEA